MTTRDDGGPAPQPLTAEEEKAVRRAAKRGDSPPWMEKAMASLDQARAANAAMREALAECSADLAVEVTARYADSNGKVHPANQRRYERDMEPVRKAKAALAGGKVLP